MVFVQGDWGGSGPTFKGRNRGKKPKYNSVTASPTATVDFSRPSISSSPPPAPAPAPVYQPYVPPAPPAPAPVYNPPAPSGGFNGGGGNGGGGGGGYNPPPAPPPISKKDWLAGDDVFQGQKKDYAKELADFLSRLTVKEKEFRADYETAMEGLNRNAESGLEALGQDFTNRGLAYSGMFADANEEAEGGYQRQRKNMKTSKDRSLADFDSQRDDKKRSINLAEKNARLNALDRMAMDQMF